VSRVLAFITTSKYWLIALGVLLPLAYFKGLSDGSERVHQKYAKQGLEVSEAARKAGESASAQKQLRDETSTKQNEELRNEIQTKTNEPVGTNTRRVLDGLRGQQTSGGKATD